MATTMFGAVPEDIEARWRVLDDAETTLAAILLEDADMKLDVRRPSLTSHISSGLVDGRLAVMVLADAVIRVMVNPDNYKATSIGGDGSVSASYFGSEVPRARVSISEDDLREIDRATDTSATGYRPVRSRILANGDY